MSISKISHDIKHRKTHNDKFYTPEALAIECISMCDIEDSEEILDSARGKGSFYNNFPKNNKRAWCEIEDGRCFFEEKNCYHWIITNSPYSILDAWIEKTCELSKRGFGLLLGWNNLTAKRIEYCEKQGFGLTKLKMFKVFQWYGMSCFVVFERGKKSILEYNRKVWR
jgi:hypothetical protein